MPSPQILLLICGVLGAAVLALGVLWWQARRRRGVGPGAPPKPHAPSLFALRCEPLRALGERQLQALAGLAQALPQHVVLARVPLAQFLRVGPENAAAWASLVGPLEADVLVCDLQGRPMIVIDLLPAFESTPSMHLRRQRLRAIESAGIATLSCGADEEVRLLAARVLALSALPPRSPMAAMAVREAEPPTSPADRPPLPGAIPVAEVVELSAEDLPEFAPTTIFRPDDATLPQRP